MAVQLFADGALIYDHRLEGRKLLGLKSTEGLNKSGTAEFIMPPGHPHYNKFTSYKTIVALYEDGALRFRGRALYPADDIYNRRTIICEGERGFFRDAIIRPYLYQDPPEAIFADALAQYNAQVDEFKRFTLGVVTVTDSNDYVRLESSSAQKFSEFIDKLVERCGGYVTFSDNAEGGRQVNWLAEIGTQSDQAIEFGENLLEYSRSGQSDDLATAILPYGAQLEDGTRVTIASVTEDGADWIQDDEAVALRGFIMTTETWDDVTTPENLLTKARKRLAERKLAVTSLQLSAADLSRYDKSVGSYHVGDRVPVRSKPHNVDDFFQLTDRTIDWLNPSGGNISLGKTQTSLTGSDVAGDRNSASAMDKVKHEITTDYTNGIAAAVRETTLTLSSLIQQTSESIMLEVSETYAKGDDVTSLLESRITQLADSISFEFSQLETKVDEVDGELRTQYTELIKYVRIVNGDLVLGESGNEITLHLENDRISFLDAGAEVAYISHRQLYITDAHFLNSLRLGRFAWIPRSNGNLSLVKVGG